MSSAVRTIGGLTIALGVLNLGLGIGALWAIDFAHEAEDPDADGDALFDAFWWSTFWTMVLLSVPHIVSGVGLINGQAWARPLALAMAPWMFLIPPLLGTALAIATVVILTGRDADIWLGQAGAAAEGTS